RRSALRIRRSTLQRSGFGYLLAIAAVAGGLSISFRVGPGLYILAFILVVVLLWSLWDAWGLLMGVADEEIAAERKARWRWRCFWYRSLVRLVVGLARPDPQRWGSQPRPTAAPPPARQP